MVMDSQVMQVTAMGVMEVDIVKILVKVVMEDLQDMGTEVTIRIVIMIMVLVEEDMGMVQEQGLVVMPGIIMVLVEKDKVMDMGNNPNSHIWMLLKENMHLLRTKYTCIHGKRLEHYQCMLRAYCLS